MPAKISIIIPTYNSFSFIKDTLESLEKQTNRDFEVVVADDRSTDETYLRLMEYSASSSVNMRVYQNDENAGPGITRNFGLSKAIGEYVTFIDSDDTITADFVDCLVKIIEKEGPDCIVFDYNKINNGKIIPASGYPRNESGFEDKRKVLVHSSNTVWGKIFRKKVIDDNKILFPKLYRNEDFCFAKIALAKCGTVYILKKPLYNYIIRDGSVMKTNGLLKAENSINAFLYVEKELKNEFYHETEAFFIKMCIYGATLTMAHCGESSKDIKSYIKSIEDKYPDYENNEYLASFPLYQRRVVKAFKKKKTAVIKFYSRLKFR